MATRRRSRASSPPELSQLAEAKLAPPRLRHELVDRPAVRKLLDAGEHAALTLVVAPAGYGKTSSVRSWAAAAGLPVAWVTLDAADNDPARLWTFVARAVERLQNGPSRRALTLLGVANESIVPAVDELMNGLSSFDGELVIVLDDLHHITDPDCIATIARALERMPANVRLVAISRRDPPLPLALLRARGEVADIRADALAFATTEISAVLRSLGSELGVGGTAWLLERTEGWPAAVVLAAVWLRGLDDPEAAVRRFGGDQRFVMEFLSSEVLDALDEQTADCLLRIAVLREFTVDLCDSVLGRTDSTSILSTLEGANVLVQRLEPGTWFRVHSLLSEFAAVELARRDPGAVPEVHRRAASWLHAHGQPVEALQHAEAAADEAMLAAILAESHLELIRGGRSRTVLRYVSSLSNAELASHPDIAAAAAMAAMIVGNDAVERRRLLGFVEQAVEADPELVGGYADAAAGVVRAAVVEEDVGRAVESGRHAVLAAQAGGWDFVAAALAAHARALFFAGRFAAATEVGLQALAHPGSRNRPLAQVVARSTVALAMVEEGALPAARGYAEVAKALARRLGGNRGWMGANAATALGAVLEAEGDLAAAERELVLAEHAGHAEPAGVPHAWRLVHLGRIRYRRGRLHEAEETLATARDVLSQLRDGGLLVRALEDAERELADAVQRAGDLDDPQELSAAEDAVLQLLPGDATVPEIAAKLYLSPSTIRSHTRSIYRKLGVHTREGAVARADALGLLGRSRSPS